MTCQILWNLFKVIRSFNYREYAFEMEFVSQYWQDFSVILEQ
jgi:hypothetical protein